MASQSPIFSYAKKHYQLFLWIIIVTFVVNEAFLIGAYQNQTVTTDIINQAGRQRMYSQKIAKLTQYYKSGDYSAVQGLQEAVELWSLTHQSFMDENSSLSKFYYSNDLIKRNFDELTISQEAIEKAVNQIIENPEADNSASIATVMANEVRFLATMDIIVNQIETEADKSYFKTTFLEIVIGAFTFLGLSFLIFYLMVPMITELRTKQKLLSTTIAEKNSLLAEVHHRVKNNLAILSGMFQLQLINREYNAQTFENAIDRVQSIAGLHEFLYSKETYTSIKIDEHINELIKRLSASYSELGKEIQVNVLADPIEFKVEKATPFALLLNELITNSLKHAFKAGDIGQIDIVLTINEQNGIYFSYQDNGRGAAFTTNKGDGIGSQLINSLTNQLESEYVISFIPSFSFSMIFNLD